MAGLIPDETLREIRQRASLVEVVSETAALKRRGRSWVGLCPFHAEKTPSFTVSEDRGFFHCFGCGEHGDVFAFVMKTQAVPFPEAARAIAARVGVTVPEEPGRGRVRGEPLIAANVAAAAFFRATLRGPAGVAARTYLAERGVSAEMVERHGLGYAPGAGDALVRHLRTEGYPTEDVLTVGLVGRRASGMLVDRFRDRIIFPITDAAGRVIAFGGRILPGRPTAGDPPPKYLNSPDSPVFHKGQTLYGLALARDAIRSKGRAIVVEGYLDVIALAQHGVGEVVAPLGTALTVDQVRVLRRFAEVVVACFDGDPAGRRAAARSFAVFLEAGMWGTGVFLPSGDDPDSFVRSHGGEAFAALADAATPLVDAYLSDLVGNDASLAVGRRAEGAREVARVLQRVHARNPYEFNVLVPLAAQRLGVQEEFLRAEGLKVGDQGAPASRPAPPVVAPDASRGTEALIVELMAADAEVAHRVRAAGVIADFEHAGWRRAAETLATALDDGERTTVVQTLPKDVRDRVVRRLLGEWVDEDRERELADCLLNIRARRARRTQQRLREEIRAAEARGDLAAVSAAMQQLQDITQKDRT